MAIKSYKQEIPVIAKSNTSESLVSTIKRWKEDAEGWVGTWEENQVKWHKLRMRIKKPKTFPFKGCSNIRMPTVETKIRKLKAALVNVLFGIRPVVAVTPTPTGNWDTARKIEKYLDHLIMDVMEIKDKVIIAIDQTLEKGFYLMKPFWRVDITNRVETLNLNDLTVQEAVWLYDTARTDDEIKQAVAQKTNADLSPRVAKENNDEIERIVGEIHKGVEEIKFTLRDVIYDAPDVALCSPERVYVPPTSGYNPQSCSYLIHEFILPLATVKANAETKGWEKLAVDEIESKKDTDLRDKNLDVTKDEREGIERLSSGDGLIRIWECYCNYDINNDGAEEKCIITIAPDFNKVLRKLTLPFDSGKFPFVKMAYELTDDRWFSHRGIPELIEDIVKEIDIQHMQKIDYGTLANSPMFLFRANQISQNTVQFVYGQGIPVSGLQPFADTFAPVNWQNPNVEFSYEKEQQILQAQIEECLGQVDFTLQSQINKRQPRTLGEVQLQQQSMQTVFSLDADMFRESLAELINWIWELDCQYGDEEKVFSYLGQNGYEKIKLTREEIQGKYKFTIRGNDQNTNPQNKLQKAQFVLQDVYQALQMGMVAPEAVMAARKRAYQVLDIDGYEEFLQPPQPQQPVPAIKLKGADLTDAEQAQVLVRQGIQPDMQGRALKKQDEHETEEFEQLSQVAGMVGSGE